MNILQPVEPPASRKRNRIHSVARWWTWSADFKSELPALLALANGRGLKPRVQRVKGLKRYGHTFSLLHTSAGQKLAELLSPWAKSLDSSRPGHEIWMMRNLDEPNLSSLDIRLIFTGLRDAICPNLTDPRGALYAPLGDTGGEPTEFPLHCDLYSPRTLWNVFDDVSQGDRSGASIFLPAADMLGMAMDCKVPTQRVKQLRAFLKSDDGDRYDEFYKLLYSDGPGFADLDRRMRAMSYRIRLKRGEGYMIDDRVWMHGRTLTNRTVTRNRLHRLVF